jgi:hypothetical protein
VISADAAVPPPDAARAAVDTGTQRPGDATSAVTSDAAGDMGIAPPVPAGDCKGIKFCDDFESYPVDQPPKGAWTATAPTGGATLVVDGTRPFSGTKSIHITTPGMKAAAMIRLPKALFPLPQNNLFGRMMVFFVKAPIMTHFTLFASGGPIADGRNQTYSLGGHNNGRIFFGYGPPEDYGRSSQTLWPNGRWACIRWQFDGSAGADGLPKSELRAWLDGKALDDMTIIKNTGAGKDWPAPNPFSGGSLGFANYQIITATVELWIDDLAVDSRPLDCPSR